MTFLGEIHEMGAGFAVGLFQMPDKARVWLLVSIRDGFPMILGCMN